MLYSIESTQDTPAALTRHSHYSGTSYFLMNIFQLQSGETTDCTYLLRCQLTKPKAKRV
jgi:hypothetical protein